MKNHGIHDFGEGFSLLFYLTKIIFSYMVNAVFFIINVIILYFMKKRKLLVSTPAEALKVMTGMLSANMIDNELVTIAGECDENGKEIPDIQQYHVRLGWLYRGDDDLIGCPCFACDFDGMLPTGDLIKAVVYVKVFATKTLHMCRMHRLDDAVDFREIKDGEKFNMHDAQERFPDEVYLYQGGQISLIG